MINFQCGCSFDVDDSGYLDIDINNVPLNCEFTWDLICSGNTLGVFQLEKQLGQTWAKRYQPRNIEDLAVLVSILRPGCLESGMSDRIVKIRNGEEEANYLVPELEPILGPTLSCLVYQEQAILIASKLAGFDLIQADILRKAMGKKKSDIMASVKKQFITGCKKQKIVTVKQAEEIFSWIQESERYSFNKSHAVCYAVNGYMSAYTKAHFALNFYKSYLKFAKYKINPAEETRNLVKDGRCADIDIKTPSITNMNPDFIIKDQSILFGLTNIKGIGVSVVNKLETTIKSIERKFNLSLDKMRWLDILCLVAPNVKSNSFKALIQSGSFNYLGLHRKVLEYEHHKFSQLTKKEQEGLIDNRTNFDNLLGALTVLSKPKKEGGIASNKNRVEILEGIVASLSNPPFDLRDDIGYIVRSEVETLSVPLSYHMVQSRDSKQATHTCYELMNNKRYVSNAAVAVSIDQYREHKIKKGNNKGRDMAFLTVSDDTSAMENVVIFPDSWEKAQDFVIEGNTVLLVGNKKKSEDSFIVNEVHQI